MSPYESRLSENRQPEMSVAGPWRRRVGHYNVLEANFIERALLAADGDYGTGDVFEAAIFYPELVVVVGVYHDSGRNVAKRIANQRETGLVLADSGLTLTLERGVDQGELPSR